MKSLLALLLTGALLGVVPAQTVVDRVEGNMAVVEFSVGDFTRTIDVPVQDFNKSVVESEILVQTAVVGEFHNDFDGYFQFKSVDNKIWWLLTEDEMGFTPEYNKKYTLYYYDNGTTEIMPLPLGEDDEWYVYDDIYLGIVETR